MDRFEFFQKAFHLAVGKTLTAVSENPIVKGLEDYAEEKRTYIRPPGALEGDRAFKEHCSGCDACMIACPFHAILIDDMEKRYPFLDEEGVKNCVDCVEKPCIASCGTGALKL